MASAKQPVSALPADFVEKIKQSLIKEKERIEKDLGKFAKKDTTHTVVEDFNTTFPDYGDKDDENAAEVADYAANLSIEEDLEKMLRDINGTLSRIEKGAYGICKYCKKPIELKRLTARPTSSACVECKKTITQEV